MNYNDNLSPRDVQELAGHANLNTTFGYVHPSKERINKHATALFNSFSVDDLYKNGDDILNIPIYHIATIILGDSSFSNIEELKITLSAITNEEITFFNISEILKTSKEKILEAMPTLTRIEKYKYSSLPIKDILDNLTKEFGKSISIENRKKFIYGKKYYNLS